MMSTVRYAVVVSLRVSLGAALLLVAGVAAAQTEDPPPPDATADAVADANAVAPEWTFAISPYGLRTATARGAANFGSKRWAATLLLECAPGHDGALTWTLLLDDAQDSDGFDFGAFEGPDAPANGKQVTQLALEGGLLTTRFATTQTGRWAKSGQFAFSVSARAWEASNGALLADAVGSATQAILWSLRSPSEASQVIVARFDAQGAPPVLRDAMQGCGPRPALAAAAIERWTSGNAAAIWQDRAMTWRLRGLLGSHYDAFAGLNWSKTLAADGDVYYLLAVPDGNGKGGALMLNADGILEAFQIEAGNLTRSSWNRGTLRAPAAVREYLATNVKSEVSPPDVN